APGFDMDAETAKRAIDRIFEFPGAAPTIEFQGGEPLLAFPVIQAAVLYAEGKARSTGRQVSFSIATTLHQATDPVLDFLAEHRIRVSTSLDGAADLHNGARLLAGGDAWDKTVHAVERARVKLGDDAISATTTITRPALDRIEDVVDTLS